MVVVQIARKLSLSPQVIFISMPDLHFDHKLLPPIIHYKVCASHTSGL